MRVKRQRPLVGTSPGAVVDEKRDGELAGGRVDGAFAHAPNDEDLEDAVGVVEVSARAGVGGVFEGVAEGAAGQVAARRGLDALAQVVAFAFAVGACYCCWRGGDEGGWAGG